MPKVKMSKKKTIKNIFSLRFNCVRSGRPANFYKSLYFDNDLLVFAPI